MWKLRLFSIAISTVLLFFLIRYLTPTYRCPDCNVLFLVSDSLRADVLGAYGGEARTPHIDSLAAEGALYEDYYSNSPWTVPSVVTMFTGTPSPWHRIAIKSKVKPRPASSISRYVVSTKLTTFGTALQNAGYATSAVLENFLLPNTKALRGIKLLLQPTAIADLEKTQTTSLELLKTVPNTSPFFHLHWYIDPHSAYGSALSEKPDIDLGTRTLSQPYEVLARLEPTSRGWKTRSFGEKVEIHEFEEELTEDDLWYLRQLYIREVEEVDRRIGELLQVLRERNLLEKTMIVFTSDHGEQMGEHGSWGHGRSYYQEEFRVPLILRVPNAERGRRVKKRVSHLELAPTLLDILGLPVPESFHGRTAAGLLRNESSYRRRPIFLDGKYGNAVIRGPFKLIRKKGEPTQFYNLKKDPREQMDLVDSPKNYFKASNEALSRRIRLNRHMRMKLNNYSENDGK